MIKCLFFILWVFIIISCDLDTNNEMKALTGIWDLSDDRENQIYDINEKHFVILSYRDEDNVYIESGVKGDLSYDASHITFTTKSEYVFGLNNWEDLTIDTDITYKYVIYSNILTLFNDKNNNFLYDSSIDTLSFLKKIK